MFKLHNTIQNYAWGSETALTDLFNIPNYAHLPMAEIWMGAHPKSSSRLIDDVNSSLPLFSMSSAELLSEIAELPLLSEYINNNLHAVLGDEAANRFKELPYLFKVLCAKTPLSIQVHPNKEAAVAGFKRENELGLSLDSPVRDYKDANHKPELIYALTDFIAMNAFRTLDDISDLISPFMHSHILFSQFYLNPSEKSLAELFEGLLKLSGDDKNHLLKQLRHQMNLNLSCLNHLNKNHQLTWQVINTIFSIYPDDMGAFAPLILNVIHLKAGEAMFLYANTPHAYLNGTGLEIMANSDNVLRAGLTPKNINIQELISNIAFKPTPLDALYLKPNKVGSSLIFPIPVEDFCFAIHHIKDNLSTLVTITGASIFFCIKGKATVKIDDKKSVTLNPGESCFVSMQTPTLKIEGESIIAQAYYSL